MERIKKGGFTLIELIVVVGIILMLAASMIAVFGGSTEAARSAKCKTNMRNLANAVHAYAMKTGHYPLAGSRQFVTMSLSEGNASMEFREGRGWIGWNDHAKNVYPVKGSGQGPNSSQYNSPFYDGKADPERGSLYALTNGVLWSSVNDFNAYICPSHQRICGKKGFKPVWSYVMNSRFGYDKTRGSGSSGSWEFGMRYEDLTNADRTLLFAELPFLAKGNPGVKKMMTSPCSTGEWEADCTLQYDRKDWNGTDEAIGFNHEFGSRKICAHVVFADSHVEELELPKRANINALRDLTAFLCEGVEVTYQNGTYVNPEGKTHK